MTPATESWLEPLRRELAQAAEPVTFFFRDDDAGWDDDSLIELLDLFAGHAIPLDLAVIPAALGPELAAELRRRVRAEPRLLGLHQHGFAHANQEPTGRPCEFGPSRARTAQRRDLQAGARRLRELLGESVAPIFTPPWNRCTRTTALSLRELGFRALSRDATAEPLELPGLREIRVGVDWLAKSKGTRIGLDELGERLAAAARSGRRVGVMLHHAQMDAGDRAALGRLLALLAADSSARCRTMSSLLGSHRPLRPTILAARPR